MVLSLVLFAATAQAGNIAEFFPVVPGTVRTYEQKGKGQDSLINTVGKPLDMGGVDAIPITENSGGVRGKTTYYRIEPNQVTIVAYDVKNPLPLPLPVMKLGTGKVSWDFDGKTATGKNGERLRAHGEAHLGGSRNVLGKKVDTLEVKLKAAVGMGLSGVQYEQTAVYGRGVGLVYMKTIMHLGKREETTEFVLSQVDTEKQG